MTEFNFNIEEYINLLPDDIEIIILESKNLTYIPDLSRFKNLKKLYCQYNQLTYLPSLPNSLTYLYCYSNQLTNLPTLSDSLECLDLTNTNLDVIISINYFDSYNKKKIQIINNELNILNKFRNLYFTLKFKKQFYKLYEKVAIKRYHPLNLIKLLENVGDDEDKMDLLLESW